MNNPEDTLIKRQFPYIGDVSHELYNLPGTYIGPTNNEVPNADGGIPQTDVRYYVEMDDGTIQVIDIEDETSNVDQATLKKVYRYKTNLVYGHKKPVISVISTTLPIKKCSTKLEYSQTDFLIPIMKSLPLEDAWERLNMLLDKIKKQEMFSNIEALELITHPRKCTKNQDIATEKICNSPNELICCM